MLLLTPQSQMHIFRAVFATTICQNVETGGQTKNMQDNNFGTTRTLYEQ
jgi:hypothetical protein